MRSELRPWCGARGALTGPEAGPTMVSRRLAGAASQWLTDLVACLLVMVLVPAGLHAVQGICGLVDLGRRVQISAGDPDQGGMAAYHAAGGESSDAPELLWTDLPVFCCLCIYTARCGRRVPWRRGNSAANLFLPQLTLMQRYLVHH